MGKISLNRSPMFMYKLYQQDFRVITKYLLIEKLSQFDKYCLCLVHTYIQKISFCSAFLGCIGYYRMLVLNNCNLLCSCLMWVDVLATGKFIYFRDKDFFFFFFFHHSILFSSFVYPYICYCFHFFVFIYVWNVLWKLSTVLSQLRTTYHYPHRPLHFQKIRTTTATAFLISRTLVPNPYSYSTAFDTHGTLILSSGPLNRSVSVWYSNT